MISTLYLRTLEWLTICVDVDSIRYYGRLCLRSGILLRPRQTQHHWSQLASHDVICNVAGSYRMLLRLHVPRVTAMVHV
jgi:hypothetical protein